MAYKVVALDLDGTLLDSRRCIPPDNLAALKQARAKGLTVMIASGRHHIAVRPYQVQANLETPAICCNGAYVYDFGQGRTMMADPLEKAQAEAVAATARRHGVWCSLYAEDSILFEDGDPHHVGLQAWAETLPPSLRPRLEKVADCEKRIESEPVIWKCVLTHPQASTLRGCVDDLRGTADLNYEWSWFDVVDVVQKGWTKGDRLSEWARREGVALDEILAVGDNYNDISMLTQAGTGVAMGNSDDAVKAYADWVTSSNDACGVAVALRRFVL